jgi:hypothetical protein
VEKRGKGRGTCDELPGPAGVGEAAVGAHPVGLGHVDAGIDAIEDRVGDLGKALPVLGGADGVNLLELGRFQFAQHVKSTLHRRCGENVFVGSQQIAIAGHLQVLIGIVLGHGLGGRLVVYDYGVVVLVHQQQVDDAHQHELRGQTVIGVKFCREGQFHLDDGMDRTDRWRRKRRSAWICPWRWPRPGRAYSFSRPRDAGFLFQVDTQHLFEFLMQCVQRFLLAGVFQRPVKQFLGSVDGFTEGQGDADPFRLAFLDVMKPVFEGAVEVGEDLVVADIKVLAETLECLVSVT